MRRQYDAYVGNLLVASDRRSLVWCFDPSQSMLLKDGDVIQSYGGPCPSGVIGWVRPFDLVRPGTKPRPRASGMSPAVLISTAVLPSGAPEPLASLPPGWHVRIYRPPAPPTP